MLRGRAVSDPISGHWTIGPAIPGGSDYSKVRCPPWHRNAQPPRGCPSDSRRVALGQPPAASLISYHRKRSMNPTRIVGAVAVLALSVPALAQQASVTLTGGDTALCLHNDTSWSFTKTPNVTSPVPSPSTVSWTVTATRGSTTNDILEVNGFVRVTNTGTAPATIGNIVVNLQRRRLAASQIRWVSAAADVA